MDLSLRGRRRSISTASPVELMKHFSSKDRTILSGTRSRTIGLMVVADCAYDVGVRPVVSGVENPPQLLVLFMEGFCFVDDQRRTEVLDGAEERGSGDV